MDEMAEIMVPENRDFIFAVKTKTDYCKPPSNGRNRLN
jgi:hypothetical protein